MFNINTSTDDNRELTNLASRIDLLYDYVREALHMMNRHVFHMRLDDLDKACIRYNRIIKHSKNLETQKKDLILPVFDTIFGRYILGINDSLYEYVTDRYPELIDKISKQ